MIRFIKLNDALSVKCLDIYCDKNGYVMYKYTLRFKHKLSSHIINMISAFFKFQVICDQS